MRMMMKASIPVVEGNKAISDGTLNRTLETLFTEIRPETSYFFTDKEGRRAMLCVFDFKEPSQMVAITEPLFTNLNAEVHYHPVMNFDDLKTGLQKLPRHK
jgi:hypothetical protein